MWSRIMMGLFAAALLSFAADVTGAWKFSVTLDNGQSGGPAFVLKQSGNQVSGTYTGPLGKFEVKGTVSGEEVNLTFSFRREDVPIEAKYEGKLSGDDKMSGKVTFSSESGSSGGTFTAEKEKH